MSAAPETVRAGSTIEIACADIESTGSSAEATSIALTDGELAPAAVPWRDGDDGDDGDDGVIGAVRRIPAAGTTPPRAAPRPPAQPPSVGGGPAEMAPLLRDLRRELSDSHAAHARSANAITSLAGSLKEVVGRQQRHDRGLNLNSFVAYVIFTALLGGGFFMLYRTRADKLVEERDAARTAQKSATDEAARARTELDARDAAQRKALDYWTLLTGPKREDAIVHYAEIMHERLTPVETQAFQAGVARARAEIVDSSFADGVEAFGGQQWKRAAASFKRALGYEADGPRAAQMRYYQGVSAHKLGDYAEAQRQLELAIAGGADRTVGLDARFYLASALEMLRQPDRARAEYEKFASGHPMHPLAPAARRKMAELAQQHTVGSGATTGGTKPAGAPPLPLPRLPAQPPPAP